MTELTARLLAECRKCRYTQVLICQKYGGWMIEVKPERRIDGWPAIWKIVENLGILEGCGSTYSHQAKHDADLTAGQWTRKPNGKKWQAAQ